MADKEKPATDSTNHPADKSELNPAGSARRRMMRRLNAAGAAALTGVIATGWKKPIVEAVLLPAHAQATGEAEEEVEGPEAEPCSWGATLIIASSGTAWATLSASLLYGSAPVAQTVDNGTDPVTLTAEGTHPLTGVLGSGFGIAWDAASATILNISMSATAPCCGTNSANSSEGQVFGASGDSNFITLEVGGGMCSVSA